MTFTSNLFQSYVWSVYPEHFGPLWSVAVEEQFYLWAAPAFLLMPARLAPRICFAVLAVALTVGIVIYSRGLNLRAAYTGSLTNFGLMALGGAAVLVFPRNFLMAKLAAPALIFYLACPVLAFLLGRSSIGGELIFWLSGVLIAIVLTGIVAEQSTWLVRVLEFPPVRYIGVISYGVYIYHSVIILPFGPEVLSSKARTVIEIVASIGVAAFSWHFIEHPLLDLRDNLRQRRSPVLASGA